MKAESAADRAQPNTRRMRAALWACMLTAATGYAHAVPFTSVFYFGDSLTDSGNNAAVLFSQGVEPTSVPVPSDAFVPTIPYASGRYTNSSVWAERFAAHFGMAATPSLLGGSNHAFGGATTGPNGLDFPVNVREQVAGFLAARAGGAPPDALYVLAGGGNDAREAIAAVGEGADPVQALARVAGDFASNTLTMIGALTAAGAEHIVVWTAPDASVAPAVRAAGPAAQGFASALAAVMNEALRAALEAVEPVRLFDLHGLTERVVADPGAFGLFDVEHACAARPGCDPSRFLFWDGIHPTSAGHALIAAAMIALVPEPHPIALLALALLPACWFLRRRVAPADGRVQCAGRGRSARTPAGARPAP